MTVAEFNRRCPKGQELMKLMPVEPIPKRHVMCKSCGSYEKEALCPMCCKLIEDRCYTCHLETEHDVIGTQNVDFKVRNDVPYSEEDMPFFPR